MLKVEIIAIGNEVLRGFITNTNGAYLAKVLTFEGFDVNHQQIISDDAEVIKSTIQGAMTRNDIVITSGGLGPTGDDITRHAIAELFESDFIFNEVVAEDLKKRFNGISIALKNQATIPSKAKPWLNPLGTAPALLFDEKECKLILLPGVPPEMHLLLDQSVLPYLRQIRKDTSKRFFKSLKFYKLKESEVDPMLQQILAKQPDLEYGIYPGLGVLSINFAVVSKHSEIAEKLLNDATEELLHHFGSHYLKHDLGSVEREIQEIFIKNHLTLGVAESCTGGAVSSRITKNSGASNYFIGGIVSYTNEIKIKFLGVDPSTIEAHGAVSEEVVRQMAIGAINSMGCDYSLAVSGVAGPTGGTAEKPIGTVWCAIGQKGKDPLSWKIHARGDRQLIIDWSCASLFNELYSLIGSS